MKNNVFDDTVNNLNLNILYSGYVSCDTSWHIRNCAVPFCRLYIIESGEGILECGGETVKMAPNFAYLLPTEASVSYSCPSALTKLFFHLELLSPDRYDLFYGHNRILRIPLEETSMAQLIALYQSSSFYSCLKLKQLLYDLLLQLYRQLPLSDTQLPSYCAHVRDTIDYIHKHLSAQLTVDELARRQYISHTTLNKRFRAELGMTVGKYIDDQLIMQAKALLCHTKLSIAEISTRLGFSDQFYFSSKFKAISGFTPLQFRKTHTAHTPD